MTEIIKSQEVKNSIMRTGKNILQLGVLASASVLANSIFRNHAFNTIEAATFDF